MEKLKLNIYINKLLCRNKRNQITIFTTKTPRQERTIFNYIETNITYNKHNLIEIQDLIEIQKQLLQIIKR